MTSTAHLHRSDQLTHLLAWIKLVAAIVGLVAALATLGMSRPPTQPTPGPCVVLVEQLPNLASATTVEGVDLVLKSDGGCYLRANAP